MNQSELPLSLAAADPLARRFSIGRLLIGLCMLELLHVAILASEISQRVDAAVAASPLIRPGMRYVVTTLVFLMAPLVRMLCILGASLLSAVAARLMGGQTKLLAIAFAAAVASLPLAAGKLINGCLIRLLGAGNFKYDYFSIATWASDFSVRFPLVSRLDLWDMLAMGLFIFGLHRFAQASWRVAFGLMAVSWGLPLMMAYQLQQVMGR